MWLGEYFANLALHAWMPSGTPLLDNSTMLPRLAALGSGEEFEDSIRDQFERTHSSVGGPNYVWYQFRLQVAAAALYDGLGVLGVRLFDAFSVAGGTDRDSQAFDVLVDDEDARRPALGGRRPDARRLLAGVLNRARAVRARLCRWITLSHRGPLTTRRLSSSRFVDIIGVYDTSHGMYLAAADACWDMILSQRLREPCAPKSFYDINPRPYRAGKLSVGIRFQRGLFLDPRRPPRTVHHRCPADAHARILSPGRHRVGDAQLRDRRCVRRRPGAAQAPERLPGGQCRPAWRGGRYRACRAACVSHVTGLSEGNPDRADRPGSKYAVVVGGEPILDRPCTGYADQAHLTRDLKPTHRLHTGPDEGARRGDLDLLVVSTGASVVSVSNVAVDLVDGPIPVHRTEVRPV